MIILKKIWDIIYPQFIGYLIAIVVILFLVQTCKNNTDLRKDLSNYSQNVSALTDTLKKERLKNGDLQYSISGFIISEKNLKDLNLQLYNDVKEQKGRVISINRAVINLNQNIKDLNKYIDSLKTIIGSSIKLNDSTYILPWTLSYTYDLNNYDTFKGETELGLNLKTGGKSLSDISVINKNTELLSRSSRISLVWGQKMEKGKLRIFVNSAYPGFSAGSLEGVLLDAPSKKHWFPGWSIGIGITPSYDFINQKPAVLIGPTLGWQIYQF